MPRCLPEVAEQADKLLQGTCPVQDLCVPCFDPLTGQSTGACTLSGDPGPSEPPGTFAHCCDDRGRCVSRDVLQSHIAASDLNRLGTDTCSDAADACVPKTWLDSSQPLPTPCRALAKLEGRCLPACLPEVSARADQLRMDGCDTGELCVPCFDPLTGEDTGACKIGADPGPSEPPMLFASCCMSGGVAQGTCVPNSLLPDTQRAALPAGQCASSDEVCVPNALVHMNGTQLPACNGLANLGLNGAPGLCLNDCFLQSSVAASQPQGNCSTNQRCVACAALRGMGIAGCN
jgi:hypothetical protein